MESKIYSESREKPKNAKGESGDELSEQQIKINEAELRRKYYRLTSDSECPDEEQDEDEAMTEYYENLDKLHEKIERLNN